MRRLGQSGLSDRVMADLRSALAKHDWVESALLFGSRANGNFRDGSDIDLAVLGTANSTERAQLWADVDSLPLVFKVDLVFLQELDNPALKRKILDEGALFYPAK